MGDFRGISVQASLVTEVEETIKKYPFWRSVAEFASEAIRLRLEEFKRNPTTTKEAE